MSKVPREWSLIQGIVRSSGRRERVTVALGDVPGEDEIIKVVEVIEPVKELPDDEQAEPET